MIGPFGHFRRIVARSGLPALLLCASACSGPETKGDDAGAEAQKIWQNRCATCHGAQGAGDGPSAAGLDPKPRNFQNPAWQASVDDAHIKKVIVGGGAAAEMSPVMAPNPDLDGKEAVLDALVLHVRKLQK